MNEGSTEQIEMTAGLDLGDKYSYLYVLETDTSGLVTFSRRCRRMLSSGAGTLVAPSRQL
jgi:hypothetical protein